MHAGSIYNLMPESPYTDNAYKCDPRVQRQQEAEEKLRRAERERRRIEREKKEQAVRFLQASARPAYVRPAS